MPRALEMVCELFWIRSVVLNSISTMASKRDLKSPVGKMADNGPNLGTSNCTNVLLIIRVTNVAFSQTLPIES